MMKFLLDAVVISIASIAAFFLAKKAVAKADPLTGRLPKEYQWMETPDALGWGAGTYEPEIKAIYDRDGKEAALVAWLRRNKAYGAREQLRADLGSSALVLKETGPRVPPRWGFWMWKGTVDTPTHRYFDCQVGFSIRVVHVYLRCGWKLKPLFINRNDTNKAIGFFQGITPRMDDWDDYPDMK